MISLASDYSRDPVPSTLEALMDLPEEHFVWGAYRALLGRDPDPEGLGHYLEKLRSGCLKVDILTELRDSPEGSIVSNRARGLSRALARTAAPAAAVSLAALMNHRGQRFVYCAYRTLLGRDPNADEVATCLRELRDGGSRIAIVARLRHSRESQPRDIAESQGLFLNLDLELRRFRWSRFPVIGPLLRRWYDVEDDGSTSRRARRIETQLHSISEDLAVHLGVQGDGRTWNAGATTEPATEPRGDALDQGGGHGLAGARPARMAAALLCTLPASEDDRITGQERWQP